MNLSRLKKAHHYEVEKWLTEELKLPYEQKRIMRDKELVRWSPFIFFVPKQKQKVNFIWRFTMLLLPLYIILVWIFNPLQFIFTGKWGISQKFLEKFHYPWMNKLNLKL